jgi:hypothetical protein
MPTPAHRAIRLSREDGTQSLYFNQNAYTADGEKLIVTGRRRNRHDQPDNPRSQTFGWRSGVGSAGHKSGDVRLHNTLMAPWLRRFQRPVSTCYELELMRVSLDDGRKCNRL